MPAAFTFNCPTEVEDAAENYHSSRRSGAEVYIATTDTPTSRTRSGTRPAGGGEGEVPAGRRSDAHADAHVRRAHRGRGLAAARYLRRQSRGVVKTAEIHDNAIARDGQGTLRKLQARSTSPTNRARSAAKCRKAPSRLPRRWTSSGKSDRIPSATSSRRLMPAEASLCSPRSSHVGDTLSPARPPTCSDSPRTVTSSPRSTNGRRRARCANARRDRALSPLIPRAPDGQDTRSAVFFDQPPVTTWVFVPAASRIGTEFTSLVLALLQARRHSPKLEPDVIEQIGHWKRVRFETYMSLTCHNCPDVVQALN